MKKFIWISGSINSGKTTVAKLLADEISNGINIELDILCHFDTKLPLEQKLNFIIQDALDLAGNWTARGFLPILNWPLNGEEAEFMLNYAKQSALEPVIINLTPDLETLKKNRGERELTEWELNRIDFLYHTYNINTPKYGISIDNTHLSATETANKILGILKEDHALATQ